MFRYILRRIISSLPVLAGVVAVTFALARLIPGNPCTAMLGEKATREVCERFNREKGLDQPLPVQFGVFARDMLRGDLGDSIRFKRPVVQIIVERLPGLTSGAEEHKMGIKGSSTTALVLSDVRTPVENLLGEIGKGHKIAFNVLNAHNPTVRMIWNFFYQVTEPALRPIRSVLPSLGGIDISPLILIIGLMFLERLIVWLYFQLFL